ncbi:MAG TPA: class I SAM-dependent methyltransferase [Puia sp.]|nr:class I SAM-dependent methyltransferase [Puia sp.]
MIMNPEQAFQLIKGAPISSGIVPPIWADLGSGSGIFTEALARMFPGRSIIFAVDKGPGILSQTTPGGVSIQALQLDFEKGDTGLRNLDGILMANSLHYVKDKPAFLGRLKACMNPGAPFLIVEYDSDRPVPTWVPYPVSYASLQPLFAAAGYAMVQKLATHPSVYHGGDLYAAWIEPV